MYILSYIKLANKKTSHTKINQTLSQNVLFAFYILWGLILLSQSCKTYIEELPYCVLLVPLAVLLKIM